ncbi:hypothetical protein OBBRIDRAFT_375200 [Obba rivulosa]|uniref:Fungal-type protein kinase domain-containing protein n=1 Tax=Obba rivulosa TaxID=1052685 RepID=A0A8E2AHZ2_9APHY|nr:hypothetical protein OBBRIDRAFT_375200 [Obba rivulosa]
MEGLDAEDVDRHNYKHHWNDAGGIGEIKKQPKRSRVKNPLCIYLSKLRLHAAASSSMLSSTASVPVLAKIPKRKRHASDVGMSSSSKRAKNADQPFSDLSDKELQTAKYLNELLSHHVRSYGTGFLLDQTKMTLWYCDRMGLVQSEPFDIFKNFEYLVLMVAALAKANLSTLGFCPFLELPSRHQDHTFDGVSLNLPDATDSEGERIGPVAFDLDVNKSRKLINGYGAIGRGTAVIPVKTIGNSRALFGDKNLRAKIAWPQEDRDAEDELIRKIRRAIDENDEARRYLKHIVDLKCSLTLSMEDVRLPRIFMDDVPLASSHRRMWRALVMEEYLPLQLVDSVDEFKEVFKHVLHGHRWAWEAAGVLHRDVSIYNVMFYRDTETGKVIGVLCDWDLAQERDRLGPDLFEIPTIAKTSGDGVHENTDGAVGTERKDHPPGQGTEIPEPLPRDAARYRTGTGPFMAIDLLTEKITPEHQYRYDLESFFYVLVWFCAGFRPESHDIEPITAWQTPNLTDIGSRKREFIVNDGERAQVLRSAHPECKNLASEWIDKLYLLFADLLGSTITIRNLQLKLDAAEKSNHLRKVERYHKKTQKAVDRMHKLVTFKSFMRRLRKT